MLCRIIESPNCTTHGMSIYYVCNYIQLIKQYTYIDVGVKVLHIYILYIFIYIYIYIYISILCIVLCVHVYELLDICMHHSMFLLSIHYSAGSDAHCIAIVLWNDL